MCLSANQSVRQSCVNPYYYISYVNYLLLSTSISLSIVFNVLRVAASPEAATDTAPLDHTFLIELGILNSVLLVSYHITSGKSIFFSI